MPRLLVVMHEDDCPPAMVGGWLADAGLDLDVRRPYRGEPQPEHLAGHDGLLVLGGPMDADDDAGFPWLPATRALLREAVEHDVPALGVCLGHQLLAVALGGAVARNPRGRQVGLLPVTPADAAADDPLLRHLPDEARCLHWNQDVVTELPPGATLLAQAPAGEVQAARFGPRVWGVQPHPEVDAPVVQRWADSATEPPPPGVDRRQVVADVAAARDELERTWRPVVEAFAALVGAPRTCTEGVRA